jgi:hypothetical protein
MNLDIEAIKKKYATILTNNPPPDSPIEYGQGYSGLGRPPSPWHPDAIAHIVEKLDAGCPAEQAYASAYESHAKQNNVDVEAVGRMFQIYRRHEIRNDFASAVFNHDFEWAAKLLRLMNPEMRLSLRL